MSEPSAEASPGSVPERSTEPGDDDGLARGLLRVPLERLTHDWAGAQRRAEGYLALLGLGPEARRAHARGAVERAAVRPIWRTPDAIGETLAALREELAVPAAAEEAPGDTFLAWRLAAALGAPRASDERAGPRAQDRRRLHSAPTLRRGRMVPHRFERRGVRRRITPRRPTAPAPVSEVRAKRRGVPWVRAARRRRLALAALVLAPTLLAMNAATSVLPHQGRTALEVGIVFFFGLLFAWISVGFWTAALGFFVLATRRDRWAVNALPETPETPLDPGVRTAIVMPICDEPVERVFAGLRAIHASLARTGELERFDFFVLSDTPDAATWAEEEQAWFAWCREIGFDRVFYRHRLARIHRKSGNVADFCRRWGSQYRYMVVLDADSVMSGDAIVRLVRIMEARPDAGMVQTVPIAVGRRSLFARIQQFSSRIYGPIFSTGLHFWQLGDGQYWGHNAILRLAPFMKHCGLPRLPGRPPLGGEIMSHDFVEAALMGRAGYTLWLAYDLPGSFEEVPSSLLEEMGRDRRWCQGNLQHLRLIATEGLFGAHRALFLNGALSYVSALLWFCFLLLSTSEALWEAVREPDYFPAEQMLFPEWPVWHLDRALILAAATGVVLFLPKLLGLLWVTFVARNLGGHGGALRLVASALLEVLFSSLLAPIRMVFHMRFVVTTALGRTVAWRSPPRSEQETRWRDAVRYHGLDTVVASVWGLSVYWLNPEYFFWVTPLVAALIFSVPLSTLASRVRLGEAVRRRGLFLIPEEVAPPPEIHHLQQALEKSTRRRTGVLSGADGFVRAVVDPLTNAVHCALRGTGRAFKPSVRGARRALAERALREGPWALSGPERRALLADGDALAELHRRIWALADLGRAARWRIPV
jgi:membrane glycosyltransferase